MLIFHKIVSIQSTAAFKFFPGKYSLEFVVDTSNVNKKLYKKNDKMLEMPNLENDLLANHLECQIWHWWPMASSVLVLSPKKWRRSQPIHLSMYKSWIEFDERMLSPYPSLHSRACQKSKGEIPDRFSIPVQRRLPNATVIEASDALIWSPIAQ